LVQADLKWKRGYDLGISKNAGSDYTASLRVAFDKNGDVYIDGGYRDRIEYPEQRRYILGRIDAERDTEHGVELSANGHAVIQDLRREKRAQGRALRGIKTEGDKITNALTWIALAEEGRIHLVRAAWNDEFIDEAAAFPSGTHDDQIDAVSLAFRMHRQQSRRAIGLTAVSRMRLRERAVRGYNAYQPQMTQMTQIRRNKNWFLDLLHLRHLRFSGVTGHRRVISRICLNYGVTISLVFYFSEEIDDS